MKNKQHNVRDIIGNFLFQIVNHNSRFVHLSPDGSIMGERAKEITGRYFDLGIAEQNTLGVAAGLAIKNKFVIINSIASFIITNAYMQLRNLICYHNLNVVILGVGSGLSYGALGFTHHANEDLALLIPLPNMKIYLPADAHEAKAALADSIKRGGPSYIRIGAGLEISIYNRGQKISFTKPPIIREGKRVLILASGVFVSRSLCIIDILKISNINAGLVNINSMNLFDKSYLKKIINKYKIIISIEEHYIESGVGNYLKRLLENENIINFGLPKELCAFAGSRYELLDHYGLSNKEIANKIIKYANKK